MADGVILVAREGTLKRGDALRVREVLAGLGTTVLGVLANRVSPSAGGFGNGYGYEVGRGDSPTTAAPGVIGLGDRLAVDQTIPSTTNGAAH